MRTKEFIKRVEELGYLVNEGHVDWQISRLDKGQDLLVAIVNKNNLSRISTDFGGWWNIEDEDKSKLLDLIVEFAKTPVEDREEEKRYYLRHKWVNSKTNNYLHFSEENNFYNLSVYKSFDAWKTQLQFTEKEIEEIKKKFDTDLKDFELVEVKE